MTESQKASKDDIGADKSVEQRSLMNQFNSNENEPTLETFNPVPYCFVVKDVNGKGVNLPPHRRLYARVECPPFHVLLDHLLSVLWIYYSKKELDMLESSHIHWALKVLEGTKNQNGMYTDDVQMAMDHLTDAYIDVCSNADVSKLELRSQCEKSQKDTSGKDYSFQKPGIPDHEALENASLHLADLVSRADASVVTELLAGMNKTDLCVEPLDVPSDQDITEDQRTLLDARNNKFREVITLIEEIKRLDDSLLRNSSENVERKENVKEGQTQTLPNKQQVPNEPVAGPSKKPEEEPGGITTENQEGTASAPAPKREVPAYDPRMVH